jgi:hypothetical protein
MQKKRFRQELKLLTWSLMQTGSGALRTGWATWQMQMSVGMTVGRTMEGTNVQKITRR